MNSSDNNGVNVIVDFNRNDSVHQAVETGTPVQLNNISVGKVQNVSRDGDGTHVTLSLDADKAGVVQKGSAAAYSSVQGAIVIYNGSQTNQSVTSGEHLTGLNSSLEAAAWQAGKAIGMVQESMQQAADSFQTYMQSEEWQQTRDRVTGSMTEFANRSREAADGISGDVERMMKELESSSRETVDKAREQFSELEKELKSFAENNQDQISETVTSLLRNLQEALDKSSQHK